MLLDPRPDKKYRWSMLKLGQREWPDDPSVPAALDGAVFEAIEAVCYMCSPDMPAPVGTANPSVATSQISRRCGTKTVAPACAKVPSVVEIYRSLVLAKMEQLCW